jgi:hypothetical protein
MRSVIRFGVMGVAVLVLGSTAQSVAQTTTTARFAQVAVGGGFSTTFTLMNTGSTALTGNLVLTLDNSANVTVTDLVLNQTSTFSDSSIITFPISSIPPGGTMFLSVEPTDPNDRNTAVGWGRVDSVGGTLGGVATFAYTYAGQLQTIAGVLSSDLVPVATIPVDDDKSQQRITGYAVANPGSSPITIKVLEVPADGSSAAVTLNSITLQPGEHKSAFFYEDPNAFDNPVISPTFRGSAVLIGQAGATFCVVALVQVQGAMGLLYTVIPVFSSKAPIIN